MSVVAVGKQHKRKGYVGKAAAASGCGAEYYRSRSILPPSWSLIAEPTVHLIFAFRNEDFGPDQTKNITNYVPCLAHAW